MILDAERYRQTRTLCLQYDDEDDDNNDDDNDDDAKGKKMIKGCRGVVGRCNWRHADSESKLNFRPASEHLIVYSDVVFRIAFIQEKFKI